MARGTSRSPHEWDGVEAGQRLVAGPPRDNRVQWGPVWAGLVVALAAFVFLQLGFFAADAIDLDLNPGSGDTGLEFWTAAAAVGGFLLGGLVVGATTKWRNLSDSFLQGLVMWALGVVTLIALAGIDAGSVAGSLAGTIEDISGLGDATGAIESGAVDTARDAAGDACLFLGLTLGASVLGALLAAKVWPRRSTPRTLATEDRPFEDRPFDDRPFDDRRYDDGRYDDRDDDALDRRDLDRGPQRVPARDDELAAPTTVTTVTERTDDGRTRVVSRPARRDDELPPPPPPS